MNDVPEAHAGIALATALAGVLNAALLWRYLRKQGIYQPEAGWGWWMARIAIGLLAMAASVLAVREFVGSWTELATLWRWLWLLAAVGAGVLTYAVVLVLLGLRPRHLRV